ncbi:MAG: hypothetical protein IH853_02185 [Bacteroidetes bacterium]|nr:hypothetical protein [Bacteroidota bacterium]MCH8246616.1 hypothetical protein [Bacteroidota bacterium]
MQKLDRRPYNSNSQPSSHVPIWATLLFVVTMLAVYFLAREVMVYYDLGSPILMVLKA